MIKIWSLVNIRRDFCRSIEVDVLADYMTIVSCFPPKSLSTSSRISFDLTTLKNKSEMVFATRKLRPAWILVFAPYAPFQDTKRRR